MLNLVTFPIKGTFYYDAALAFTNGHLLPNTPLDLKPEPHNPHDAKALQIWYQNALLGYVPKYLAWHWPKRIESLVLLQAQPHGHFLWIECCLQHHGPFWQVAQLLALSAIVRWQYRLKLWLLNLTHRAHS